MRGKGFFITFEGSEGCGKSTQIRRMAEGLRHQGREVIVLREPGGTPIGEAIRHLLQHDENARAMTPEAELLLFSASRAQLVREVIAPALQRGAIVLCDRFLDSTTVYQGVARALDQKAVATMNDFAIGGKEGALPHRTVLLDLDVEKGRARAAARNGPLDRMEQEGVQFYEAVRRGYLELARAHPERFLLIDASGTEEEVEILLREQLQEHCHGLF
jgi:dTMP kinase